MMFGLFTAGDIKNPWIYTNFPVIDDFSNFNEYIRSLWKCMMNKLEYASKILVCPPSTMWVRRGPSPSQLGYPTDLILRANAMVHDLIDNIIRNINVRDRTPTLVDLTVCGDETILSLAS